MKSASVFQLRRAEQIALGSEWPELPNDEQFVHGFVWGAMDIWRQVKDRI